MAQKNMGFVSNREIHEALRGTWKTSNLWSKNKWRMCDERILLRLSGFHNKATAWATLAACRQPAIAVEQPQQESKQLSRACGTRGRCIQTCSRQRCKASEQFGTALTRRLDQQQGVRYSQTKSVTFHNKPGVWKRTINIATKQSRTKKKEKSGLNGGEQERPT